MGCVEEGGFAGPSTPPGGGVSSVHEGVYCTKQTLALSSQPPHAEQSEVLRKLICVANPPQPYWQYHLAPADSYSVFLQEDL